MVRRLKAGKKLCEDVNDLESVDMSRLGSDPEVNLESWETAIGELVKKMQRQIGDKVQYSPWSFGCARKG
jgi:hypothetical protein